MRKRFLLTAIIFAAGVCGTSGIFANLYAQQPKPPGNWPAAKPAWPNPQDWMDGVNKRLEKLKAAPQPGPDVENILARIADLTEQMKKLKDDPFRFGRYLAATNALMDAADKILWARKIDPAPQNFDYWGASFVLQGCYFRVKQADYFSNMSGAKKSDQYVKLSRRLYQQGRGAYDAKEYQRARLLGDASTSIVFALECLAQAGTSDPHIYR